VLETLDGAAVRTWSRASLAALGRAREEIDAINVFPVADGDTGTNMYLTFEAACERLGALDRSVNSGPAGAAAAFAALADGALDGAHGNSGVILSQLLHGVADTLAAAVRQGKEPGPRVLAAALGEGARQARLAVSRPVEGTMLSIAAAAAMAAESAAQAEDVAGISEVADAAREAAVTALEHSIEELPELRSAGCVDAGGLGLCVMLEVLAALLSGYDPERAVHAARGHAHVAYARRLAAAPETDASTAAKASDLLGETADGSHAAPAGPAFEVIYLVETSPGGVADLRGELEAMCAQGDSDSLVIAGGADHYRVHVHTDRPGPAIEAAIRLGQPHDLRITALHTVLDVSHPAASKHAITPSLDSVTLGAAPVEVPAPGRVILAPAPGPGIAELFRQAGAVPLPYKVAPFGVGTQRDGSISSAELARAIAEAGVEEVVIVANDAEGLATAAAAADQANRGMSGVRVAVVPAKAVVQGIAAVAVHEPSRRFDADIVAMTAAAGATRYGALQVAAEAAWTMAGVCRPGDVLGLIDEDVALIEPTVRAAALALADMMVSAGGEMVTLVTGVSLGEPPELLVEAVTARVHARRPEMDVVAYEGGQNGWPLLIGVE
jgi:hypothetical protein